MRLIMHITSDHERPRRFWRKSGGAYVDFYAKKAYDESGREIEAEKFKHALEKCAAEKKIIISAIPLDYDSPPFPAHLLFRYFDRAEEVHVFAPDAESMSPRIRQIAAEILQEEYMSLEEAMELARENNLSPETGRMLAGLTYAEAYAIISSGEADISRLVKKAKAKRLMTWGIMQFDPPPCNVFQDVIEVLRRLVEKGDARILLTGMTGSGKTYIAKHAAAYANMPSYIMSASELAKKFFGPKTVYDLSAEILNAIKWSTPLYLVMNELEAALENEGLYRIIAWLEAREAPIILAATTVKITEIDQQVIRPGRFDAVILMPLPSTEERIRIARTEAEKLGYSRSERELVAQKAAEMIGATPAEVADMVRKKGEITWNIDWLKRLDEYEKYVRYVEGLANGIVLRAMHEPEQMRGAIGRKPAPTRRL
ncbi:MAG: AAA family ATPase [Nitrososphaerota archaeon]